MGVSACVGASATVHALYVCVCECVCVCVRVCVCERERESFSPWRMALADELASAGEELLERELKGDCLNRSSRNGLRVESHTHTYTNPHQPLHIIAIAINRQLAQTNAFWDDRQ